MRRSLASATLVLVVALSLACWEKECLEQLSEFCSECPTLDEIDAQVREQIRAENFCFHAARGSCGVKEDLCDATD